MKKVINKQERKQLLQNLVVSAAKVKGAAMVQTLRGIHAEVADIYRKQFQLLVPEISFPRQKELIRLHMFRGLSHQPRVKLGTSFNGVPFGVTDWVPLRPKTEAENQLQVALHENMFGAWGVSGVITSTLDSRYLCRISLSHTFPDVPSAVFDSTLQEGEFPNRVMTLNAHCALIGLHKETVSILEALKALLDEGYETYQELEAALAPVKTPAQLYELMPESMPHWPETLKYAPPTKELADPAAINDIRAKLKKGLPI